MTPSTAKEAKEAKEAKARKAKARVRTRKAKEKEMMQQPKLTSHRRGRRPQPKHDSVTTVSSGDIWARIADTQTAARLQGHPPAALKRQRAKRAARAASAASHRPREG